jgi:hypothetical protein
VSRIETEHNGHRVTYAENEDVWRCWDMNVEGKTLSAVKTKLNKLDADARRCNVPVIVLHHYCCEVDAVGLATLIDGNEVWVTSKDRRGRAERRKVSMSRILLDTAENRAAIEAASVRRKEGEAIIKEANAMVSELPHVTVDDLKSITLKEEPV